MKTIERSNFGGRLADIYQKQKGKCNEAGCRVYGIRNLTQDHKIPKAIARLYGLPRDFYESKENKQLICVQHHLRKDRGVNKRMADIRKRSQLLESIKRLYGTD